MQRSNEWFFPAGTLADNGWDAVVDARIPGWQHTGLRVAQLDGDRRLALPDGEVERLVIPLAGSFRIELAAGTTGSTTFELAGRLSVFDGPSDVVYLGDGGSVSVTGVGRVAVAEAPTTARKANRHIMRGDVPIELRGGGRSSRQVQNFGTPGTLDASKLIVCEVITPAGNWSSYPGHKHDELVPGVESRLEEIYYFESAVERGTGVPAASDPFGTFATYSSAAGQIDTSALVRSGDIALVPYGYHGPAAAAPGYDLYYLNVMAGPDD
ncbi:MAG TPA: 5-deoxy-glucuronate isomerase, partial [Galbitalea sp.]